MELKLLPFPLSSSQKPPSNTRYLYFLELQKYLTRAVKLSVSSMFSVSNEFLGDLSRLFTHDVMGDGKSSSLATFVILNLVK